MGSTIHQPTTRSDLEQWLTDPAPPAKPPVVMIVRRDDARAQGFVDIALGSAQAFNHRELVWVKDTSIIEDDETTEWFKGNDAIIAVVLNTRHRAKGWVNEGEADETGAELAYAAAEAASGEDS
jgi:hypothetical protein